MSDTDTQASDSEATGKLSTQPTADDVVGLGVLGWLRWTWRQLTSMRTALLLLFLLALGSIPGSILPQRPLDPTRVERYIADSPTLGQIYEALGFFDVFASPWYAAVYVLLLVSLVGCIIPRTVLHWKAIRSVPPRAPSKLRRMPEFDSWSVDPKVDQHDFVTSAAEQLKKRRWRVSVTEGTGGSSVAAEKGYLREVGNLVFHLSLVVLLLAVAVGGMFGWRGQALVIEGESFSDTLTQYDSFNAGSLVNSDSLPPFTMKLDEFTATFEQDGPERGAPRTFSADVTYRNEPGATPEQKSIQVNDPLIVDGAKVFLIGHGYAPVIKVTDKQGNVVYDAPTVFLPTDGNFTSTGVVKMPDIDPQLGLQGLFLPTAAVDEVRGPHSIFPELTDPALFVSAWEGNLGLDNGVPQSVYTLDTSAMKQLGLKAIQPGQTWKIPGGLGTVSLTGVKQYATFDVAYDPTKEIALVASILAILGLMMSLFIPRRRLWVRIKSDSVSGNSLVEVAALSRTDEAGLRPALDTVADGIRELAAPVPGKIESPPTDDEQAK